MTVKVIRSRTFRTGVQTLTLEGMRYYMNIKNRTYRSRQPVPAKRVPLWLEYFDRP